MTVRKPISFFFLWASSFPNTTVKSSLSSSVYSWYFYGLVDGICYLTHTHTEVVDMVLPVYVYVLVLVTYHFSDEGSVQ